VPDMTVSEAQVGQRPVRIHGNRDARGEEAIEVAAASVLAAGLLADGSAFTPGRAVWTAAAASELVEAFVKSPDAGRGDFVSKLRRQVGDCSPEAIQLLAELQFLTILPLSDMTGLKKRARLAEILSWLPEEAAVPAELEVALDAGVFNGGMGFTVQGWRNFGVLISFVADWKHEPAALTDAASRDPWMFRDVVMQAPGPNPSAARNELLYLAFPDVFEPIVNQAHKRKIRDAFVDRAGGSTGDVDRDLLAIRNHLEAEAGEPIEFYQPPYAEHWRPAKTEDVEAPVSRRAWLVRGSSVRGVDLVPRWLSEGWVSLAASQLPEVSASIDRERLRALVDEHYTHVSYSQRDQKMEEFHSFLARMSAGDIVAATTQGSLYLGEIAGPARYVASSDGRSNLRRDVAWTNPTSGLDYADLPAPLAARLQSPNDVLDLTQQLAELDTLRIALGGEPPADEDVVAAPVSVPDATPELAESLLVPQSWLQECVELLRDRPQLIFYGPPGTGKTYLAQHLAWHLAGRENTVLVQFHPAYSYEDFFEGFRPVAGEAGTVGFRLQPGPFRRIVDQARERPQSPYVLIIDEINRGNLAKIFGELYFLLEYRDQAIELLYSSGDEQAFTLPPNVFLLGTMNTADRSIALVDTAMRRRFSFVRLHPSEEPAKSMLARWLDREGLPGTAAALLDRLNGEIQDPDFKIGPSYLMRRTVYEPGGLERAWRTSILPLLEEYHYGENIDVDNRYGLTRLEAAAAGGGQQDTEGSEAADAGEESDEEVTPAS
jgi:5-methylcytosine-specific restriction enzyme B